jgi:CitB family two-component system sensor histidine kinase MalK
MKLQTKLILLVSSILMTSLLGAYFFLSSYTYETVQNEMGNHAKAVSSIIAVSPEFIQAIADPAEHRRVQELAEVVRRETGDEYISIIDMQGVRLSHPNPSEIGQHFAGGDEAAALQGASYISVAVGTLGKSVRAFQPVYYQGRQIGVVVTGVSMEAVQRTIDKRNLQFLLILLVVWGCGIVLTMIVAQRIKSTLLGMEPFAIARLMVERNTVIKSVREGVVVVDTEGHLQLVNREARRIFAQAGITGELIGRKAATVIPNSRMLEVVHSGQAEFDQEQHLNNMYILTNRLPLVVEGKIIGSLATFRDLAEIRKLAEELTGVKRYVEALRAQAHEFRNQLHVINGLILNEHYHELSDYIQELSAMGDNEIHWVNKHVRDSVLAAFFMSKLSRSREMGVNLILDSTMSLPAIHDGDLRNGLVTIIGNLIDNAIDAVQFTELKNVNVGIHAEDGDWYIQVEDTGCGFEANKLINMFQKGYSTKGENRGFGLFLVGKVVEKYHGHISVDAGEIQGTVVTVHLVPEEE